MRSAISTAAAPEAAIPHSGQTIPSSREETAEPLAVFREVDSLERRAENRETCSLDRARKLERCLPAELDDDALGLLTAAHREHARCIEGLEVQAVGRVVVGGHRLRVAVDHHRLVAERAEGLHGVDAAVVELDALPDAIGARAENDDARRGPGRAEPRRARPRSHRSSSRRRRPRRRTSRSAGRPVRRRPVAPLPARAPRARARTTDAGCRATTRTALRVRASPSRTPR